MKEEEFVKRIKNKLWLYGSYTREALSTKSQLEHIKQAMARHEDWPIAAAQECGFMSLDNRHTEVQRMLVEKASLERRLTIAYEERAYLGLDSFINSLTQEEMELLRLVFVENLRHEIAGQKIGLERSSVSKKIDRMISSFTAVS